MKCVLDIKWENPESAIVAFLCMTMMPFTYNISYGIAFSMLAFVLIKCLKGKIKEVKLSTWVITLLFGAMLLLTH